MGPVGQPDAFLIAFDQAAPAQGPNHAWFLARRPRFLYVDRICVHPQARKRGLARALYSAVLAEAARRGKPVVCCEVNSDPPNPGSDAFHAALGFSEVGRAFPPDRGKSVRYLELGV
jgi:predicted GNAT superfamily acetyltransferase